MVECEFNKIGIGCIHGGGRFCDVEDKSQCEIYLAHYVTKPPNLGISVKCCHNCVHGEDDYDGVNTCKKYNWNTMQWEVCDDWEAIEDGKNNND